MYQDVVALYSKSSKGSVAAAAGEGLSPADSDDQWGDWLGTGKVDKDAQPLPP